MDPVDVLTMAVDAAQAIRSADDPEAVIASAYGTLNCDAPDDRSDAITLRIVRLLDNAGEDRRNVVEHIRTFAQGPYMNRPSAEWGADESGEAEVDPEAEALLEYVESDEGEESGVSVLDGFGAFAIATRSAVSFFGGQMIIERDGQQLTEEEAGQLQEGDSLTSESDDLPVSVRGLIDYPLDKPVLFTIETGESPWDVWEICCAFADQYAKIYEHPSRHGVWGHDMTDLWVEGLFYFPEKRLLYPHIGS